MKNKKKFMHNVNSPRRLATFANRVGKKKKKQRQYIYIYIYDTEADDMVYKSPSERMTGNTNSQ